MDKPRWQWDECQQVGTNFEDPAEVELYDARHAKFRNIDAENAAIIEALELKADQAVLEVGTGTGSFAIAAARRCRHVYAADVSPMMLDFARTKAQRQGVSNIDFVKGGFLTYEHTGEPLDAVVSGAALHHLPDFWKLIGLRRLASFMRPGGRLYLMDVVFSFGPDQTGPFFDGCLRQAAEQIDERMAEDWARHFRQEFSTWSWIMDGILERAGFHIDKVQYREHLAFYYATKRS